MKLSHALRISNSTCLAFSGAGGKTTALFQLARELVAHEGSVIVTATTHLHVDQVKLADAHWIVEKPLDLEGFESDMHGVMLVTGHREGIELLG